MAHTEPMVTVAPSIYYTEPSRWFMEQLLNLVTGTQNGGIYANKPGYHNTRDQNTPTNYSVVLPPDKLGPGDKAAAYDWTFPEAQTGDYSRISVYSSRLRAAGQANDPRTDGWREFYGQADSDLDVEGWDFYYNHGASSDTSHLWHIHLSELRQFLDDLNNKKALLSILKGETLEQWLNSKEDDDVKQMLVRFRDATDPDQIWLCDGMLRRKVLPQWVDDASIPGAGNGPITNAQAHQAELLGNLSNHGGVFTSAGDPDVWGLEYPPPAGVTVITEAQIKAAVRAELDDTRLSKLAA